MRLAFHIACLIISSVSFGWIAGLAFVLPVMRKDWVVRGGLFLVFLGIVIAIMGFYI